jgi:murein DD-endopeptidase MepM/ murein hydrolase activator NlpD
MTPAPATMRSMHRRTTRLVALGLLGLATVAAAAGLRTSSSRATSAPPATDATAPTTTVDPNAPITRPIRFPVLGPVDFHDDFGDCRDSCSRYHEGNDVIGQKLQPLVAVTDGTVTKIFGDEGKHGIGVTITDADGWDYIYLHINNDTPGDAVLDTPEANAEAKARWHMPPNITVGAPVTAGQVIAFMGNSGNAEQTTPHLHFEIMSPFHVNVDPYPSLIRAEWTDRCRALVAPDQRPAPVMSPPDVVAGTIFTFATKSGNGSFTVSNSGGVLADGDATVIGSPAHPFVSCDGAGPVLTSRELPGQGEGQTIEYGVNPEGNVPDPDPTPSAGRPAPTVTQPGTAGLGPSPTAPATTTSAPAAPAAPTAPAAPSTTASADTEPPA